MVLEATMICIDNAEWMRNGDYAPSRFQAQADAVNLVCGAKTQSNPENTVGLLTMAGKRVRVLVTPTSDLGKILACMHGHMDGSYSFVVVLLCNPYLFGSVLVSRSGDWGELNLVSGIQVAQLALKHRQNKNQQQRIIVFAGSPIKHEKKLLETIGRKLKKNSVALDVVDFGESDDGKSENTTIFTGDGDGGSGFAASAAAAAAAGGGMSGFEFGVDPNIDPELALALRVSMEEERARQEAAAKKAADEAAQHEKVEDQSSGSVDVNMSDPGSTTAPATDDKRHDLTDDETALLQQALAMSMDDARPDSDAVADADLSDAIAEDQDLTFVLQMSASKSANDVPTESDLSKVLEDQSFVSSILNSLPGVDPNDPSVKDLLASLQSQAEKKNEHKSEKEDEK
ncbi:hypothetical protein HPP92_002132 [Vanilla planifolia]|uniref:26S proteasome regulatory subunit RPN10 n=1 Tax=Vanilla planifolia TaxID=51239 RepID=A0A835VM29_VANPL|nr:hypothetical protein HPP92_002132 [Vanilla planifolia]